MEICSKVEDARYSECLETLITKLNGKKILRLNYESSWSGDVDIDVLLSDGRVFSYHYYYGSCSGCDDWEYRDLTAKQIIAEMKKESTIFKSIETYNKWRKSINK